MRDEGGSITQNEEYYQDYECCMLCPHECKVNRYEKRGICGASAHLRVARAALHEWEEPCISVCNGSGTVFFSSCSLRCVYCQNKSIAHDSFGLDISTQRLADIFLELQDSKGADNINLVTPGHYTPHIASALTIAKSLGLTIPVVYNTSGFESKRSLALMEGLVDIYLSDFKYFSPSLSKRYSHTTRYPQYAKEALQIMFEQVGPLQFTPIYKGEETLSALQKGLLIRFMLLPGQLEDACAVVSWLAQEFKGHVALSLMSQYTPLPNQGGYPELTRRVFNWEYEMLLDYADDLGLEYYWQEGSSASESFIPAFDCSGVLPSA